MSTNWSSPIGMADGTPPGSPLDHGLQVYFADLAGFSSTRALERSGLYLRLRPELERVLNGMESRDLRPADTRPASSTIRAAAWNLARGIRLEPIIRVLGSNRSLRASDLLMLTELDYGMARSANRHVAREIAARLGLNYVFAPCYLALSKGAGLEADAEGENTQALHGNALMSRYPLRRAHTLTLPNGRDKMAGRDKRLGSERAVVADVEHPAGTFRAVALHLDVHATRRHRRQQMLMVLNHLDELEPALPVLIGGDWNTTTHNASSALRSIVEYPQRILMGVRHVVSDHYPYPERWFERKLFREVKSRGYNCRDFNVPGGGTFHYSIDDFAANESMTEWIPDWFLWLIKWALSREDGRCSLKLDWFAGRDLRVDPREEGQGPEILDGLTDEGLPLSDHDPILVGFTLAPR